MTVYRSGVTGVSLGHRELAEADHWIRSLDPPPVWACTHLVKEPFAHVAISLIGAGELDPTLSPSPQAAAGPAGRAVVFPGVEDLTGTLTVAEVLEKSAIDAVEVLGSGPAEPDALLDTGDFVRPVYRSGRLVLTTTPAAGGKLIPFETRNPTPCCTSH